MIRFPGFGQRNNEGPPDLDEVFKDLNVKINGLFGGKSGNGGEGGTSSSPDVPIFPILALILFVWLATGFYIVDQGSRGVVLRFGEHVETTQPGPRWHLPFPIETVEKVNLENVRTLEVGYNSKNESLMLTDDENIIDLQFAVQYNLKSVEDYIFENRSTEESVKGVAETAIREIVGQSKMDYVLYEAREEIAVKARILMQEILDRYHTGINVVNVTMQNAQPPEQVQAAFDDAVKAKQDQERQKNEGQAYANDVIPRAQGTAARLKEEAAGYKLRVENEAKGDASRFEQILAEYQKAPEVTRQRIYLDAQQEVLSKSNKVLIDQQGGNSLIYLPLDKLMSSSNAGNRNTSQIRKTDNSTTVTVETNNTGARGQLSRERSAR